MSVWVTIGIVVMGLALLASVLRAVVRKRISEIQGLFWLLPVLLILAGGLFPETLIRFSLWLGVDYAPSLVFTFGILFALYLMFRCTAWIAVLESRVQELAIQTALLNEETERLRKRLDEAATEAQKAPEAPAAPEETPDA